MSMGRNVINLWFIIDMNELFSYEYIVINDEVRVPHDIMAELGVEP